MTVRKIRPSKGINRRCALSNGKSDAMVFAESLLERDFVRLCKYDSAVERIIYQPERIFYIHDGKERSYVPDYLLIAKMGTILAEVKLHSQVEKEDNRIKFLAAQKFCEEKGWQFKVFTEHEIRPGFFQQNLVKLFRSETLQLPAYETKTITDMLHKNGPCSIKSLTSLCLTIPDSLIVAIVYKVILLRVVDVELVTEKLTNESEICLAISI